MATLYCNSITGSDSNNGSSWALAKKTLAGAQTAASAGDTVFCHGIFNEAFTLSKSLTWRGEGLCVWSGAGVAGSFGVTASITIINIEFRGFVSFPAIAIGSAIRFNAFGCVWDSCGIGVSMAYNGEASLVNCIFINNSQTAAEFISGIRFTAENCVFTGNGCSLRHDSAGAPVIVLLRCVTRDIVMWNVRTATNVGIATDHNVYDFSFGKCIINSVDYTSLAAWKTAIGAPRDANSIDRDWRTDVGDYNNFALRPTPASYLLTAGPGSTPIGLTHPAVTVSNNENASLFTGGVFTNTEIDGSGYLVLSAGQTLGTWASDVIDFGAAINAQRLEILAAGEDATNYVDYDTADSPGYYTARVRGSNTAFNKTDVSPSWVTVPRQAEIGAYMSNALRYWQIELTLRGA